MFEITAKIESSGFLLFESKVISIIEAYKQNLVRDIESAGILIGEYRGEHHIRVVDATRPCQHDSASRFSFLRKSHYHQNVALAAWQSSEQIQTWIGEWHTHPEDHPNPSSIDIQAWKEGLPIRPMVLVIQGRKSRWLGVVSNKVVTAVTPILTD
jgi:integrative and conjugative element protein (TIGR02256 family)